MEGGMIGDVVRRVADMVDEEAAKACEACRKDMAGRLMPDGLSWPIVDGQPVDFVTGYEPSLGVLEAVSIYSNGACEVMSHDGIIKGVKEIHVGKPKVLDADGVEIHVGDTVCGTRDMEPMRVVDADSRECGFKNIKCEKDGDGFFFYCADELTHKLPVLAADGRPLREGETVWHVGNGVEFTVIGLPGPGEYQAVKLRLDDGAVTGLDPDQLTHERPESWERLEHDAEKTVCEYFGANYDCANCPLEPARCDEEAKKDITGNGFVDAYQLGFDAGSASRQHEIDEEEKKRSDYYWDKDKAEKRVKELEEENEKLRKKVAKLKKRCRALAERERGER